MIAQIDSIIGRPAENIDGLLGQPTAMAQIFGPAVSEEGRDRRLEACRPDEFVRVLARG